MSEVPATLPTAPRRRLASIGFAALYLGACLLLLYPALTTPVVADDFVNPFAEVADGGPGLTNALRYGLKAGTLGINFRIVGSPIGSAFNWLWLTLSADLGFRLTTIYGAAKFVVFVLCAASVARFWRVASREYGHGIRYRDALVITSLALFGSIQIHALWSSDPVTSFPLAGYGGTGIGFAVLTAAVVASKRRTWRSYLGGTAVAVASVLYYEINVGAVIGAGVVLAAGLWARRADRRALLRDLSRSALFVGLPALALVIGHVATSNSTASYGGTDVRFSGFVRSMMLGIGGSLPGTAWTLSNRSLGGRIQPLFFVFVVTILLLLLARWWARNAAPWAGERPAASPRIMRMAIVVGVLAYGLFAIGIQAITVKVQDEARELGQVYTYYSVASCVVALGLGVGALVLLRRPDLKVFRFLAALVAIAFFVLQSTINWRLSSVMDDVYLQNRQLLNAFDRDLNSEQRCQALTNWTAGPWPEYYENGMINGLQDSYQYYFDEPFCDGFVPTG